MKGFILSSKHSHPVSQSVVIDEESAKKLQVVITEANVVINIPFIVIGLGILLGVAFIVLVCQQKVPEVSLCHCFTVFVMSLPFCCQCPKEIVRLFSLWLKIQHYTPFNYHVPACNAFWDYLLCERYIAMCVFVCIDVSVCVLIFQSTEAERQPLLTS